MKNAKTAALRLLLTLLLCLTLTVPFSATARDGRCACGREYAKTAEDGRMAYDCPGCGRNYTSCTCDTCWCGASLTRTGEADGSVLTKCDDCGLPCEECICRDRSYYASLISVENGTTGSEIPNPAPATVLFSIFVPFAATCALYFTLLRRRGNGKRRNGTPASEENTAPTGSPDEPDGTENEFSEGSEDPETAEDPEAAEEAEEPEKFSPEPPEWNAFEPIPDSDPVKPERSAPLDRFLFDPDADSDLE